MFNLANLKIERRSDNTNSSSFVGIRRNNDTGELVFRLPLGFDAIPEDDFSEVKSLFFKMYRTFKKFEKELGMRPKYYAYPFGFYNLETKNTLKAFGFDAILTVDGGAINEFSDVFSLERVPASENTSANMALSLKPLDVIIESQSGNDLKTIKGRVKNFDGKQIKMFTAKGDVRDLELDKDGAFETQVDMKKINARHRLVFKADNNRYRTKLIEKD